MTLVGGPVAPDAALRPTVSVIICCYTERRFGQTVAAVRSVQAQSSPPERLVVVVDHHEVLLRRLRAALPGVQVVPNEHERGLAGARNTGVGHSGEDVVAFLDDDATADGTWLAELLAEYHDDAVVAVGGAIEPCWGDGRPAWFPPEFDWVVGCTYRGMPRERATVRNVIGANMSFRRAPVVAAGGFTARLGRVGTRPTGGEETELCIRLTERVGGDVVFRPGARVAHHVPPERGSFRYFCARSYGEGLSKAVVASATRGDTLRTERGYVVRVLVAAAAVALREAGSERRAAPLARLGALVAGLTSAMAGFGVGHARERLGGRR